VHIAQIATKIIAINASDMLRQNPSHRHQGFTLIELIMVLVLLGVLAAFAAPRMFDTSAFNARGFHDETLGLLRYAQKTAIAQRRTVCVTLNTTGITLNIFSTNPETGTCAAAPTLTPLSSPRGGTGLAATIKTAPGCTAPPSAIATFQFTPLGSTDQLCNVDITIANSTAITIEAATGYVHE
jgi:MSHA pilin protein MshC